MKISTNKILLLKALFLAGFLLLAGRAFAGPYPGGLRDHGHTGPGDGGVLANPSITSISGAQSIQAASGTFTNLTVGSVTATGTVTLNGTTTFGGSASVITSTQTSLSLVVNGSTYTFLASTFTPSGVIYFGASNLGTAANPLLAAGTTGTGWYFPTNASIGAAVQGTQVYQASTGQTVIRVNGNPAITADTSVTVSNIPLSVQTAATFASTITWSAGTHVRLTLNGGPFNYATDVSTTIGQGTSSWTEREDTNNEFVTSTFTALNTGDYLITYRAELTNAGAGSLDQAFTTISVTGGTVTGAQGCYAGGAGNPAWTDVYVTGTCVVGMTAGSTIRFVATGSTTSGTGNWGLADAEVNVMRLPS